VTKLSFDTGLITSEQVRFLRENSVPITVHQRKNYDEFTIYESSIDIDVTVSDLMKVAQEFDVKVDYNEVYISCRGYS